MAERAAKLLLAAIALALAAWLGYQWAWSEIEDRAINEPAGADRGS